jgi:hypothetical protein
VQFSPHQPHNALADHQANAGAGFGAKLLAQAVEGLEQVGDLIRA